MKKIKPRELNQNVFEMLGSGWALLTAKKQDKINTMTVSWGGMGVMWGKNVAFIVVRPQRYTKEFIDSSEMFTLSFLPEKYRKELTYLGKVSGRNEDKIKESGLEVILDDEVPYFQESNTVLICRKLFSQPWEDKYMQHEDVNKWYPENDYHTLYIAEIEQILISD